MSLRHQYLCLNGVAAATLSPKRFGINDSWGAGAFGAASINAGVPGRCKISRAPAAGDAGVVAGTVAIWGAERHSPGNQRLNASGTVVAWKGVGDGASLTYQTDIPYAALGNNTFILEIGTKQLVALTSTFTGSAGGHIITGAASLATTELYQGAAIRFTATGETYYVMEITSDLEFSIDRPLTTAIAASAATGSTYPVKRPTTDYAISNVGGLALITFTAAGLAPLNCSIVANAVTPVALVKAAIFLNGLEFQTRIYPFMWVVLAGGTVDPASVLIDSETP